MKQPQRVHGLVRLAAGRRKHVPHGPAFRMAALVTGVAVAATTLAVTTPRPSAAEKRAPRRPATTAETAPARTAGFLALRRPASGDRAFRRSGRPPDRHATEPGPPLAPTGPAPGPPVPTTPPRDAAPQDPTSQDPASQDGASQDGAPAEAAGAETLPEGIAESSRVGHHFAAEVLRANGIGWRSTGGCSDRMIRTCTSFEQIRWGTIKGLVRFARSSGCDVVVTGGTERGHAGGTYSHWNGYKADISPSRCVDAAIERHRSTGVRGDGARLYRAPDGTLFARERDHWDITFR